MEESPTIYLPGNDVVRYFLDLMHSFAENYPAIFAGTKSAFGTIIAISIVLSLLLLIGIIYCIEEIKRIRRIERKIYNAPVEPAYVPDTHAEKVLAKRWDKVLADIESTNQNDWKQAIIEADIMLEELLIKLGYQGEGIGEMLRRANTSDFKTLGQAGEAHGVRNRIAHDGALFLLSHHEARRVIGLYRKVFEEFFYI